MIALDTAGQATFSYLAAPPTHLDLVRRTIDLRNGATVVEMVYNAGVWDGTTWSPNPHVQDVIVRVAATDSGDAATALMNLLGPGVTPSHADPRVSVSTPAKKRHDYKVADLDAVALHFGSITGSIV